jgi:hypothetical protein
MGYRDLECFNAALLAKQGWRLLNNPESLVARIFKEKHNKGESFLNSRLGRRPSYPWKSIWNAKKLLNEGLVWRVGDGKSTSIWGDRWIPSRTSYSIQSPARILDGEVKVSALVDESTMWWHTPLMHSIFTEEEAVLICNMVICPQRQQDKLVWVGTKNGIFSEKSAYHLRKGDI